MTARILFMPNRRRDHCGTVHVMGERGTGFEIGHESASGNSWGSFDGPFSTAIEAIGAAHALNRDQYGGTCDVEVHTAAARDANPDQEAF